jgi:hypothetical protein
MDEAEFDLAMTRTYERSRKRPKRPKPVDPTQEALEAFEQGGQRAMDNVIRANAAKADALEQKNVRQAERQAEMEESVRRAMKGMRNVR